MSRKKRVKDSLLAKHKKKNARMHKNNKPKYISKAERAKMEEEQAQMEQSPEVNDGTEKES
ncbi:hypothetical protein JCM19241_690 [Vibrio ishigakensis]|uniref:DUF2986 domain-containing protein n=1 Tax=Vibrio ishigakensis TaxID=1481914 RepID=A0A0B8QLJ3_9VIBR|nr:hypothetical protein JCM19241_690 [Vibrio ishigakensis]